MLVGRHLGFDAGSSKKSLGVARVSRNSVIASCPARIRFVIIIIIIHFLCVLVHTERENQVIKAMCAGRPVCAGAVQLPPLRRKTPFRTRLLAMASRIKGFRLSLAMVTGTFATFGHPAFIRLTF